MRKGITPVVATVLLMAITIGAAGTLYATMSGLQDNSRDSSTNINLQMDSFSKESCWVSGGKPKIQFRNTGQNTINTSGISPLIEGDIAENYTLGPELVEPQGTFRLSFDEPVYRSSRIELAAQGTNKEVSCLDFPLDQPKLETGSIQVTDTIDNGEISTVEFENFYFDAAAVLFIGSDSGTERIAARVQDLNRQNMTVFVENETDASSAPTETVNYLVAREGTYEINGVKFEARKTELNSSTVHRRNVGIGNYNGTKVEFEQDFSNPPMLFHSLNTYNNGNFMTTAVSGPDTSCQSINCQPTSQAFDLEQEAGDTGNSAAREEAGWIAVEDVTRFEIGGILAETRAFSDDSEDGLDQTPRHTINYQRDFTQPPITIVDGYSASGPDGYWPRTDGTQSEDLIEIYGQETYDDYHQNESFSYISFGQEFSYP